jgi:dTDP-4-dehydrorhamnose reductase
MRENELMIDQRRILFTGGSGLLGAEFRIIMPEVNYPSSAEFNVTDYKQMEDYLSGKDILYVIHAAAFTSPPRIDQDPLRALENNIAGTANVVRLCMVKKMRLMYISTDYVFKGDKGNYKEDDPVCPVNKYAWSKLGGECAVRMYEDAVIIRTSFGPNVFPFEKAFTDQWTSRESVKNIAQKIIDLLDKDVSGVVHVGGERKTVFDYARGLDESRDIKPLSIKEVTFSVPEDTSLDCNRYKKITGSK